MVICKFFLQGNCRYGDHCKFEHQINSGGTSILLHSYAPKPQVQPQVPGSSIDSVTLIKSVVNDMTLAEKGGQWLLSSYAPFKEKPAFPGFEDYSMEEIRLMFYEAAANGTVDQLKQNLQMMLQQAAIKIKALQNPSPDVVNILKQIYNTVPSSSMQPATSFSGSPNQQTSNFGGMSTPAQQTSIFAQPSNMFAGQKPAFSAAPQQNTSIFAGPSTIPSNPIFATNTPTTPSSSIFSPSPANVQSGSIYGGQSSPAAQNVTGYGATLTNPQPSIFSSPQTNLQNPSVFQNVPNSSNASIFARGLQQPSAFGNHQQQSIFASSPQQAQQQFVPNTPQPGNVFQQNAPNYPTTVQNQTNFQPPTNIFGASPNANQDFYSKIEELTEEQMKWYQSDDMDISRIPELPPTYDMCFK